MVEIASPTRGSTRPLRAGGRPRSSKKNTRFPIFFICLAGTIVLMFVVTWLIITKRIVTPSTSSDDIGDDVTVEAKRALLVGASKMFMLPNRKTDKKPKLLRAATTTKTAFEEKKDPPDAADAELKITQIEDLPPGTSLVECSVSTSKGSDPNVATAKGTFRVTVRHDISPIASDYFLYLVNAKWFDGDYFFRVINNFIAQWGIRHKEIAPLVQGVNKPEKGKRDEITPQTLLNKRGTLSFAGGNPGSQQMFVNLVDNKNIDRDGSHPFATVDDAGMITVFDKLYMGYKDGQGQVKALNAGLETMQQQFPYWSKVEYCKILKAYNEDNEDENNDNNENGEENNNNESGDENGDENGDDSENNNESGDENNNGGDDNNNGEENGDEENGGDDNNNGGGDENDDNENDNNENNNNSGDDNNDNDTTENNNENENGDNSGDGLGEVVDGGEEAIN